MQQETPQVGPPQNLPTPNQGQQFFQPSAPPESPGPYAPAPDDDDYDDADPGDSFSWEASEYIHNEKSSSWLIVLFAIALVLVGLALWLGQWTFAVLVVVMAVAMGIFAFRPPHTLRYTLDDDGVHIANRLYAYHNYRAYGVLQDGAFFTLMLIPIKRFSPALSVYFAQQDGEHIVDIIGAHLPMQHVQPDIIDGVMRRLRF